MAPRWLTEAELAARYGADKVARLADRDRDGQPDAGVVEQAILDAEGRALSRLLARYQPGDLPTTTGTTPETLKRVVRQLAWWFLHDAFDLKPEDVTKAYDAALSELADIVRGGASLTLSSEAAVDLSGPQVLSVGGSTSKGTFTKEAMEDW